MKLDQHCRITLAERGVKKAQAHLDRELRKVFRRGRNVYERGQCVGVVASINFGEVEVQHPSKAYTVLFPWRQLATTSK